MIKKVDVSTTEVRKKFDFSRQYDVFEKWLEENGKTLEDLPLSAVDEDGNDVIVNAYTTKEEGIVWRISTIQKNNWIRVDIYYSDGTVEEFYER